MRFNFPFSWYNKFGTIPSTYKEAMSYEEQILWLCKHQEELQTTITENYSELTSLIENAIDELDEAKQDKLIAGENIQIDGNVISSFNGEDLTSQLTLNSYFGDYNIGETLPSVPLTFEDTASIVIQEGSSPVTYKIKGNYIVYEIDSSTREILEKDSATLTDSYGTFTTNGNRTLIVEFSATNTYEPKFIKLESESSGGVNYITELTNDLTLTDTTISLEDGFYYTGEFKVLTYEEPVTTLIDTDSIFYYNSTGGTAYTPIFQVLLDKDNGYIIKYNVEYVSSEWQRVELSTTGVVSVSSTNLQIPTAKAVYDFVNAQQSGTITELSSNITLTSDSVPLNETGLYYTGAYLVEKYDSVFQQNVTMISNNTLFYYDTSENIFIVFYNISLPDFVSEKWFYSNDDLEWTQELNVKGYIIDDLSTDNELVTAKATYENIIGTMSEDITKGQYEALTDLNYGLYYTGKIYRLQLGSYTIQNALFEYIEVGYNGLPSIVVFGSDTPISSIQSCYYYDSINGWGFAQLVRTTSISNSSTNMQIPTALAVYNATSNKVNGNANATTPIYDIWCGTETEYNNLGSISASTLYFIKE